MEELNKLEANIKENLQDIDQVSKLTEVLQTGDYKFQAKVGLCIGRVLEEYWKAEILQDERLVGLSNLLWKLYEEGSKAILSFLLKSEDDEVKAKWALKFLSYIKIELLHKKNPNIREPEFF
ncbi:unnamed protein product [Blepharisma stoltei]|uniref:Uncharacterized protein n=1 Tax=Blepharisma stoltei TaxID=1481888 RepID=A0AAU9K3N0_9CILI|nr:unnamed protein product [Blepharisma stoltei]